MSLTKLAGWSQHFLAQAKKMKFIRVAGAAAATNIAIANIPTKAKVLVAYNETDGKHVETAGVKASVNCALIGDGKLDTVLERKTVGAEGNEWTVILVGDAPAGVTIAVDLAMQRMTIHFKPDTSTVTDVETAVAALADADDVIDVKTGGTGATVLVAASAGKKKLSGGANVLPELPSVTSTGNIQFPVAVTTGKNLVIGYDPMA